MKLNADLIKRMAAWVEENGLFPEPCGASLREFCKTFGIDDASYRRWMQRADFADALARARAKFRTRTVHEVENAIIAAAKGVNYEKTRQEGKQVPKVVKTYDPVTGKLVREETTFEMIATKAVKERVYYPPDVRAAQFVLTNLAPDKWKDRQDKNVKIDGKVTGLNIEVVDAETAEALDAVTAPADE